MVVFVRCIEIKTKSQNGNYDNEMEIVSQFSSTLKVFENLKFEIYMILFF